MDTTIEVVKMALLSSALAYGRERRRPCSRLKPKAQGIIVKPSELSAAHGG